MGWMLDDRQWIGLLFYSLGVCPPFLSPPLPFQPGGHAEVTKCRRYVTHGWQECELCSLTHSPQTLHHCNSVPTRLLMRKNRREAPSSGVFLPLLFALVSFFCCLFPFFPPLACTLSSPPSQPPPALNSPSKPCATINASGRWEGAKMF